MAKVMIKKSKSKEIGVQTLTGRQLLAKIFDVDVNHVSRVLSGNTKNKSKYLDELEHYAQYQRAYIKKRKIILGINKK